MDPAGSEGGSVSIWATVGKGCMAIDMHDPGTNELHGTGTPTVNIEVARTSWHDLIRLMAYDDETIGQRLDTCLLLDREAALQLHADLGLLLDIVGASSPDMAQ